MINKNIIAWVFVCFIQSERRFVVHSLNLNSFHEALTVHAQTFPSHSTVFCIKTPVSLASVVVKSLQGCLFDSEAVFDLFHKLLSVNNPLLPMIPVKTYQGLVPLTYSNAENRLILSAWNKERYIDATAFILSEKLLILFNEYLYMSSKNDVLNLFKHE